MPSVPETLNEHTPKFDVEPSRGAHIIPKDGAGVPRPKSDCPRAPKMVTNLWSLFCDRNLGTETVDNERAPGVGDVVFKLWPPGPNLTKHSSLQVSLHASCCAGLAGRFQALSSYSPAAFL